MKNDLLIVRIDEKDKETIRQAAARRGESMTTFIGRACVREAQKELKKGARKVIKVAHSGECPTYFRIGCAEASHGGTNTYSNAAWHLAIHLHELTPNEIEPQEWNVMQRKLKEALDDQDVNAVFEWFRTVLPRCMKLVPYRRKKQFFQGVLAAHREGRLLT